MYLIIHLCHESQMQSKDLTGRSSQNWSQAFGEEESKPDHLHGRHSSSQCHSVHLILNANVQSTYHTPATNPTIIINRIDLARVGRYTADNQRQHHLPSLCDFFLLLQRVQSD